MAIGAVPSIDSVVIAATDFTANVADVDNVKALASYNMYENSGANEEYEFYGVETDHKGVETETLIWKDGFALGLPVARLAFSRVAIRVPGRKLRIKSVGTPTDPVFMSLGVIRAPSDRYSGYTGLS